MRRSTVLLLNVLIVCAALLLPTSAAFASGSSASIPSAGSEQPFAITANFKCTIIEVRDNDLIKVRDDKSGEEHLIQLTETIPLRAQNKKQFDGRKKLQATDLKQGHRILVTKRTDTPEVVRIKVLKDKAKA